MKKRNISGPTASIPNTHYVIKVYNKFKNYIGSVNPRTKKLYKPIQNMKKKDILRELYEKKNNPKMY